MFHSKDGKQVPINQFNLNSFVDLNKGHLEGAFGYGDRVPLTISVKDFRSKLNEKSNEMSTKFAAYQEKAKAISDTLFNDHDIDVSKHPNRWEAEQECKDKLTEESKPLVAKFYDCINKCRSIKRDIEMISTLMKYAPETGKLKITAQQARALDYDSDEDY